MEKEKPYKCDVCQKRYKNLNGLKYHKTHSPPCNPELQVNANRSPSLGVAAMTANSGMGKPGSWLLRRSDDDVREIFSKNKRHDVDTIPRAHALSVTLINPRLGTARTYENRGDFECLMRSRWNRCCCLHLHVGVSTHPTLSS